MRTFKAMDYSLTLSDSGEKDSLGKAIVVYQLVDPSGEELFQGKVNISPLHSPESDEAARAVIGFLTLQPGDIEKGWFDEYTEEQKAWAESFDCEQLGLWGEEGGPRWE